MKKYLFSFLFLILSLSLFAQNQLTLNEAVSIALQKNSTLIKQKNNLSSRKADVKSAYGNLIPSLGLSGNWNWQRIDDDGGSQTDFFGNEVNLPPSTAFSRSYSAGLGGSITLFDGLSNYANISRSENNLEAAEYDVQRIKQDIVYSTSDLYYTALNASELLKVREDNVKYNEKLFETIREKNKLGSVAIADVYSQEVQLGNAQLALIEAKNNYEKSIDNLLDYLSLDILEDYELVNPYAGSNEVEDFTAEFEDLETLVDVALNNRFDYKSQKLVVESAYDGITSAQGGLFPRLTGNYSYGGSSTNIPDIFNRRVFSASLSLSIPIFSNFNTEANIQSAQVSAKNAEEDLTVLERKIKMEISSAYLNLQALKQALDVSSKNVVAAGERRKINTERYNLGSGTILDVLQADKDYTDAVRNNIDVKFQYYSAKDALVNALGKLDFNNYEE